MLWHMMQNKNKLIDMSENGNLLQLETEIVNVLKSIHDPEIPVNIYDLGLVYDINVNDDIVDIRMTLTAPNCPMADYLINEVETKTGAIEGVKKVNLELTFDPPWDRTMMSEEALLELGLL